MGPRARTDRGGACAASLEENDDVEKLKNGTLQGSNASRQNFEMIEGTPLSSKFTAGFASGSNIAEPDIASGSKFARLGIAPWSSKPKNKKATRFLYWVDIAEAMSPCCVPSSVRGKVKAFLDQVHPVVSTMQPDEAVPAASPILMVDGKKYTVLGEKAAAAAAAKKAEAAAAAAVKKAEEAAAAAAAAAAKKAEVAAAEKAAAAKKAEEAAAAKKAEEAAATKKAEEAAAAKKAEVAAAENKAWYDAVANHTKVKSSLRDKSPLVGNDPHHPLGPNGRVGVIQVHEDKRRGVKEGKYAVVPVQGGYLVFPADKTPVQVEFSKDVLKNKKVMAVLRLAGSTSKGKKKLKYGPALTSRGVCVIKLAHGKCDLNYCNCPSFWPTVEAAGVPAPAGWSSTRTPATADDQPAGAPAILQTYLLYLCKNFEPVEPVEPVKSAAAKKAAAEEAAAKKAAAEEAALVEQVANMDGNDLFCTLMSALIRNAGALYSLQDEYLEDKHEQRKKYGRFLQSMLGLLQKRKVSNVQVCLDLLKGSTKLGDKLLQLEMEDRPEPNIKLSKLQKKVIVALNRRIPCDQWGKCAGCKNGSCSFASKEDCSPESRRRAKMGVIVCCDGEEHDYLSRAARGEIYNEKAKAKRVLEKAKDSVSPDPKAIAEALSAYDAATAAAAPAYRINFSKMRILHFPREPPKEVDDSWVTVVKPAPVRAAPVHKASLNYKMSEENRKAIRERWSVNGCIRDLMSHPLSHLVHAKFTRNKEAAAAKKAEEAAADKDPEGSEKPETFDQWLLKQDAKWFDDTIFKLDELESRAREEAEKKARRDKVKAALDRQRSQVAQRQTQKLMEARARREEARRC